MTTYIDFDKLDSIDTDSFLSRKPYPYADLLHLLTPEGYEAWQDLLYLSSRLG